MGISFINISKSQNKEDAIFTRSDCVINVYSMDSSLAKRIVEVLKDTEKLIHCHEEDETALSLIESELDNHLMYYTSVLSKGEVLDRLEEIRNSVS